MPFEDGTLNVNDAGRLYELMADVKYIKMNIEQLVKTVEGNGKPGLRQDVHDLQIWKDENANKIDSVIQRYSNNGYMKRIAWTVVQWVGFGGVVVLVETFIR